MKKIIAFLLVMVLMLAMVGCSQTDSDSDSEAGSGSNGTSTDSGGNGNGGTGGGDDSATETITIWAWDPNFNIAIMEEAKNRYLADNPNVEFNIVDMAKADVEQSLLINLTAGTTETLPDIVLIEDYNAQKYLEAFPGSFADLTDKVDHSEFAPYKVQLMTLDGKVYGVPFDSGVTGTYYRKDILESAGFTAADLENITWDRFVEIGEAVKDATGVNMSAFDPTDGGLVRVMLHSAGAWYYDEAGNPFLAGNAALEKAIETYAKIINSPATMKTSGWSEWVGAINEGQAATISTGVWITGSVKAAEEQSGLWALAPIPRLDMPGSVNASNLGGSSWYVLDSSSVKDTAIDFLNATYASDIDFYQTILVTNGAVGSYIPSQAGTAYVQEDAFFDGQKVFEAFAAYMQAIPEVDFGSYTYEADDAVNAILPQVMAGGDIGEALESAQSQLESSIQ